MSRGFTKIAAWGLALVAAAMLLLPGWEWASAQGSGRVDRRTLDIIRERMEKGQALFASGDYAGAAQVFEAAHAEQPYAAFLFNAGVCYQKLGKPDLAIARLRGYLTAAPDAPDAEKVRARIAALEAASGAPPPAPVAQLEAGAEAGDDAGAQAPAPSPVPALESATDESMKSLALIETEPPGAPIKLYVRSDPKAAEFVLGGENAGWQALVTTRSPANLTLEVGSYHVVVERYLDFRACDADIEVQRAKVFHFRANLSQGAFMSFLRVSANVQGAYVFVDDDRRERPAWGTTPHGELLSSGKHTLIVEAPGFEPLRREITLGRGEQKELEVRLVRAAHGFLRVSGTAPELRVEVDAKAAGIWRSGQPPLDVRLDAGPHRVVVRASGHKTYEGTVTIPRGQVLPLDVQMVPTFPRGTAWTQAVIGAVFIGAGAYLGVQSNRLHDELESDREKGVLEQDDERVKRGRLFAIGANAGFALGGLLAGFATYNFIKDPYPESSAKVGNPSEPDDPRRARPSAWAPRRTRVARPRPAPVAPGVGLRAGPNGLAIGGSF